MSHFSITVAIPANQLAAAGGDLSVAIEPMLAPFHEFECTGRNDQYVSDVDDTEELRADYATNTTQVIRAPDGSHVSPYNDAGNYKDEFSRLDAVNGRPTLFLPEGYTEKSVPTYEVKTFAEFVAYWTDREVITEGTEPDTDGDHKYGYTVVDADGEVIRSVKRTNENKKWDWYVIGGRWSGRFDGEDFTTVAALDIDGQLAKARELGGRYHDAVIGAVGDQLASYQPWHAYLTRVSTDDGYTHEQARTDYWGQPVLIAAQEIVRPDAEDNDAEDPFDGRKVFGRFGSSNELSDFLCTREEYAERFANKQLAPYAMLDSDGWHQKGDMGWWGMSANEDDDWPFKAVERLRSYAPDTVLVSVDAHI